MSAIFKPPAQTQQPISLGQSATPNSPPPVHVRNDIATRYTLAGGYMPSANAGDGARQSFVSPPEDDRDTLEGMTGTPLPASTGFNQRLQNTGVGPTTVIDDRRPKLGRLPKGLYAATAQDDNVAAEQQLARASVSVPGQLPVAAGVGDIQGAAAMAILAPPPAPYRSRAVRPRNAAKEFANVSADQEMAQPRPPIVPGDNIPEMMQKYNQRRAARLRGSP